MFYFLVCNWTCRPCFASILSHAYETEFGNTGASHSLGVRVTSWFIWNTLIYIYIYWSIEEEYLALKTGWASSLNSSGTINYLWPLLLKYGVAFVHSPHEHVGYPMLLQFTLYPDDVLIGWVIGQHKLPLVCKWVVESGERHWGCPVWMLSDQTSLSELRSLLPFVWLHLLISRNRRRWKGHYFMIRKHILKCTNSLLCQCRQTMEMCLMVTWVLTCSLPLGKSTSRNNLTCL